MVRGNFIIGTLLITEKFTLLLILRRPYSIPTCNTIYLGAVMAMVVWSKDAPICRKWYGMVWYNMI